MKWVYLGYILKLSPAHVVSLVLKVGYSRNIRLTKFFYKKNLKKV